MIVTEEMEEVEGALPVAVILTEKAGVFLISEPNENKNISAQSRLELEKRLSSAILNQDWEDCSNNMDKMLDVFSIGNLVAVNVINITKWHRGQIRNKIQYSSGPVWVVLLLDWGETVEVRPKDVFPLPESFKSYPFYARYAILGGIKPLSGIVDYSSASLVLKPSVSSEYDQSANLFIKNKVTASSNFKVTVIGIDNEYMLHVRLFFKEQSDQAFSCLNDLLCLRSYAQICDPWLLCNRIEFEEQSFWGSLPAIPIQPTLFNSAAGEFNRCAVGFSDYVKTYETQKEEKGRAHKMLGRGRLLQTNKVRNNNIPESVKQEIRLLPSALTSSSQRMTPNCFDVSSTPLMLGRSRHLQEVVKEHIAAKRFPQIGSDSASPSNSFILNRQNKSINEVTEEQKAKARLELQKLVKIRKPTHIADVAQAQPNGLSYSISRPSSASSSTSSPMSKSKNVFEESISFGRGSIRSLQSLNEKLVGRNDYTERIVRHNISTSISQKEADEKETTVRPKFSSSFNHAVDEHSVVKLISPPKITFEKEEKVNNVPSSKKETIPTTSKARVFIEKFRNSPLLSPPTVTDPKIEEGESQMEAAIHYQNKPADFRPSIIASLEAEVRLEASKKELGVKTTMLSPPPLTVHEPDDDMRELLQLATFSMDPKKPFGSSLPRETKETKVPMLQRSKLLELIEEGRVLVRSSIPHKPTHVLREIPFETYIHDRLNQLHISKPKIIQAYVWEAILSGSNVAYVSGAQSGKTLGYMVPILSSLLDKSSYVDVPKGCSPLFVVICPSNRRAQVVHEYWCRLMKCSSDFTADVITDSTPRSIYANLNRLINGVTLLTATAPALASLLQEAQRTITFDRCAHLVLDSADMLFNNHIDSMKILIPLYRESVKRVNDKTNKNYFVPRQIVAFSSEWNKSMEWITSRLMDKPALFISAFMEAAFYGRMKLGVKRVPSAELDVALLDVVKQTCLTKTMIFCRSAIEVCYVEEMLLKININPLVAHNHSVVSDLDNLTSRWESAPLGSAILICTDDVLIRLSIRNAQTLIHYYIPEQSKYDFSYRLSFSMEKFISNIPESERAVSYLFLTEESRKPLLTLVKFMERFDDIEVPEELKNEAIACFGDKEYRKKDVPLCLSLKSFGFCRKMLNCKSRHVVIGKYDRPLVPRSGVIRIHISDVRDTTRYYARILKYWDEDKKLVDLSGISFEIAEHLRKHYNKDMDPINGKLLKVGELYGRCFGDGLLQRVRIENILEMDFTDSSIEVGICCIDQGSITTCFVQELFELSDELKVYSPQAVEVFLVGVKPLEQNTSWSEYSINFVKKKLMGRELEGNIMLALSSTLWLQPLQERKRPDGMRTCAIILDVSKEILNEKLGEKNPEHMMLLHHLCETGDLRLPDPTLGVAKKNRESIDASYAFLHMTGETLVQVSYISSPFRFYVCQIKFQDMLGNLERDILKQLPKCRKMTYEEAHSGTVCLVEIVNGSWVRGCIQERTATKEAWNYRVFFVDYGDESTCSLDQLRILPNDFIIRLPFQAIACSLDGVKPNDESRQDWTSEAVELFVSLTRDSQNALRQLSAKPTMKHPTADEVTKGPHYHISLIQPDGDKPLDLAEVIISSHHGLPVGKAEDVNQLVELSDPLKKEAIHVLKLEEVNEENLDVSPEWSEFVFGKPLPSRSPEAASNEVIEYNHNGSYEEDMQAVNSNPLLQQTSTKKEQEEKNTTLLDHATPLKADNSTFPLTKWMQNKSDVIINFTVAGITNYQLTLAEDHLVFVADVDDGKTYELNTYLFDFIIPDESEHSQRPFGVKATLRKQKKGDDHMWRRLLRTPFKQHSWLGRDFNRLPNDIDDDDDSGQPCNSWCRENVDPEYAFRDMQSSDEESTDSIAGLADECGLDESQEEN